MLYEFDKRGYKYNTDTQASTFLGYCMEVYRSNDDNIKEEEKKAMLNDYGEVEYFKLERKKYFAYVFFKDFIDGNEKLRNYLMNIIFYLIKNYSSENCEKMEDFFQNDSGYYLIMESLNYEMPSEDISNPKFIKTCFDQINQELEKRHKFGLYCSLLDKSDLGFIPTKNKIRVVLKFQTFISEMDFRFKGSLILLNDQSKEEKLIDPELIEKYNGIKNLKSVNKVSKKYIQEFENIAYNINSKNELFNIGTMMLEFIKNDINKAKDNKLKDLISSLTKKKSNERLSWEEYLNHFFFKNNSEYDNIDSYKYEQLADIKLPNESITNIIILKNNFILLKVQNTHFHLIIQNKIRSDNLGYLKGKYLFNLGDKVLIDDEEKNQINLYKLKENIDLKQKLAGLKDIFENVQTIDILYRKILPLYKENNNLIIITKEGKVTLWKNENSKYSQALSIEINQEVSLIEELKIKYLVIFGEEKVNGKDYYCFNNKCLAFYFFDNIGKLVKKGSIKNLQTINQLCLIDDKLIYRDSSNMLKVVDINTYQIVDKIILETVFINISVNKFGRIIVRQIYESDEYFCFVVIKEYSYENGKLIRHKTIKDIYSLCMAEGGNLIAFGTLEGHAHIFN